MGNKRDKKKRGLAHNDKIEYSVYVCSQHHCIQNSVFFYHPKMHTRTINFFFEIFVVINFVMRSLYFTVVKKKKKELCLCIQ
jgi:hypothetical protein